MSSVSTIVMIGGFVMLFSVIISILKNTGILIVLSEILELQKNIFRVEESEDSKIVYREFSDVMEFKLEEFRAKIIYNIEPDKIDRIPLYEIAKLKR